MRTTIDLDEPLFRQLKQEAARRETTLRGLVNEYLRKALTQSKRKPKYRFNWKVDRGGQLMPGVRLDDRKSLWDLMDGLE
jgi:hypothetical protein